MITIICVGKIKEDYLKALIDDYQKRIQKYQRLSLIELKDSNIAEEGEAILKHIPTNSWVVTLEIEGINLSSIELAKKIDDWLTYHSHITFIIGGSDGLDPEVKKQANYHLSLGQNTFPHGLFRGILLEQLYRAFKINNNETYHK